MYLVPVLLCAIEWWAVNPVGPEMVLPEAEPRGGEKGGELRLVATPGEMASLSFVLRSDEALRDVALTAKGGLAEAMDPYVVKCWSQAGTAWYGFVADHLRRKLVPELLLHDETLIEVDHRTQDNYVRSVNADGVSRRAWMSFDFDIVDYVAPMDYTASLSKFQSLLVQQMSPSTRAKRTVIGIGVTANESKLGVKEVREQIALARQCGFAGQALFKLDANLEAKILPSAWR